MARVIITLHENLLPVWEGCGPSAALLQEMEMARHNFDICNLFNDGSSAEVILPTPLTLETANERYKGIFRFNPKK